MDDLRQIPGRIASPGNCCESLVNLQMDVRNTKSRAMKLPEEKRTTLGLYVNSKEAFEMWKDAPQNVKILDVRTLEEYLYIGHAEMAYNIPAFIQTYQWDSEKNCFSLTLNDAFADQVRDQFKRDDIILVTCRSGGRSALAVNLMASLGYASVYNITDGFEGDTVKDPESEYSGKRMKNGWKNAGLPWTYEVDPDLVRVPTKMEHHV